MVALNLVEARGVLATHDLSGDNVFDVLGAIGRAAADTGLRHDAREALIRVLDQRDAVPGELLGLLQTLIREYGLFPYLTQPEKLSLAERIAMDIHRPDGALGEEMVFHSEQSLVYERLMLRENVVLSAPTSFGKSKVIDAYLDATDLANAAVIVPTIALMDETRRRLAKLAIDGRYKIITHASQNLGMRNLFVMTQERLLEYGDLPPLDFFVIDEFYKLDPAHSDGRSSQLNIAFDRLRRTGAQFYLLGPNITALDRVSDRTLQATFIHTDFSTVATDVERVRATKDETPDALAEVCRAIGPGTIVFCRSPKRTREVADWLITRNVGFENARMQPRSAIPAGDVATVRHAAEWTASAYHEDWVVARALSAGIGIHHGRLPRALGHHMVRLFNEGKLPYLLVTSTLIEGVNTSARNVVILDHVIARKKYDYFTFANIRGRSGRAFQHFVGKVVVFNPEPTRADMNVEIPVLSQSSNAAPEVLIQLPDNELTDASRERLEAYTVQDLVSAKTLKANRGVDLQAQLDAAEQLQEDPSRWRNAFDWSGSFPTSDQIREIGRLLFPMIGNSSAARTAEQLGARINILRSVDGDLQRLVANDVASGKPVDEAMEDNLDFIRNHAQFLIPTNLAAAAAIANEVIGGGVPVVKPAAFIGALENLFQPRFATVLEEYGIPIPLTRKLRRQLDLDHVDGLDQILERIAALQVRSLDLHPFEADMLADTQASL